MDKKNLMIYKCNKLNYLKRNITIIYIDIEKLKYSVNIL